MTCPIHVYYCSVVHVTILDILSIILSPIYLVILLDTCYTSGNNTLFMYTYTLHFMYSISCLSCRYCYRIIITQFCGYSAYFLSIYSYSSRHHYATTILRLNKTYKVIKIVTCYICTLM